MEAVGLSNPVYRLCTAFARIYCLSCSVTSHCLHCLHSPSVPVSLAVVHHVIYDSLIIQLYASIVKCSVFHTVYDIAIRYTDQLNK